MTNVYICRKKYRGHVYDETVWDSFEGAREHAVRICEGEHSDFYAEVVRFEMNETEEENQRRWCFDVRGELLFDSEDSQDGNARAEEARAFAVGEFVFLRAFPWNPVSPVEEDTIGVVTEVEHVREWHCEDGTTSEERVCTIVDPSNETGC